MIPGGTTSGVPRLVRRNYGKGHGYKLDGEKVPGVTTALDVLSKRALIDWAARMVAARAVDEWDDLALLPVSKRLDRIRSAAFEKSQAAALRGNQIHAYGHKLAEGGEVDVEPEHLGPVQAYARWLERWDVEPIAAETPLASVTHKYAGTADLWCTIGKRGGEVALVDIKTGKGVYTETAWQLAAYRYSEICQIGGEEVPTPAVEAVYVAHVDSDDVRMVPVEADARVFRSFLYILQTFREVEAAKEWPLIGEALEVPK